jgi:hypothetical protein
LKIRVKYRLPCIPASQAVSFVFICAQPTSDKDSRYENGKTNTKVGVDEEKLLKIGHYLLQNTALFLYQKELKIWNECFPKTKRVLDGGARVLTPYWAQHFTLYILYWMIFIKVFQLFHHSKYIQWFPYMIFIEVFPTSKYI